MEPSTINSLLSIAERFGFPAALDVVLILFGWFVIRGLIAEVGRLTRAVTLAVLSMQFAPQFHSAAKDIYDESLSEARKRGEDLSAELQRHPPPK